jgi:chromosome segregation ATPase
LKKAH